MWRTAPVRSATETRRRHEAGVGATWFWCGVVEGVRFFFDMVMSFVRAGRGGAPCKVGEVVQRGGPRETADRVVVLLN